MRRREMVVATAGAVLLAGCSEDEGPDEPADNSSDDDESDDLPREPPEEPEPDSEPDITVSAAPADDVVREGDELVIELRAENSGGGAGEYSATYWLKGREDDKRVFEGELDGLAEAAGTGSFGDLEPGSAELVVDGDVVAAATVRRDYDPPSSGGGSSPDPEPEVSAGGSGEVTYED